jgi:NADH:ubiquinone oxidoreductase subunit E
MTILLLLVAAAAAAHSKAFVPVHSRARSSIYMTSLSSSENQSKDTISSQPLDQTAASDFTIQVCTSTNCAKRLKQLGLDQYHILGEIYARAQARNVQNCMIIEDGTCQGGKNCKLGPCVAILHDDFDGNVALEGMSGNEFKERV